MKPERTMDTFSPRQRSEIMRRVRGADTKPEMTVRRLVHKLGFRYRLHVKELPGHPDLVFPKMKKVIFIHGCFWHGHRCPAAAHPQSHRSYWEAKLKRNAERDRRNLRELRKAGWDVRIIWECQIRNRGSLTTRLLRFLNEAQNE
jgi:DNA mismatch endonuclease (patch repair protein)